MNLNKLCRSTEQTPFPGVLRILRLLLACILALLLTDVGSVLAADAPARDLGRLPFIVTGPVDSVHWVTGDQWVYVTGFGATGRKVQSPGLSYVVIRMTRDGMDATPSYLPDMSRPGHLSWGPQAAGDVGVWRFGIVARDGARQSTNEYTLTVHVVEQHPLIGFRIGSAEAPPGADVCIPLSIHNLAGAPTGPARELGGFDILLTYDAQVVTLTGLDLDGSILVPAEWEYLTYRVVSTNPAKLRIVAIADMNNGNQHPNEWAVNGLLANICFRVATDLQVHSGPPSPVRFWWDDCGDNVAPSRDGIDLYIITSPNGGIPWFGGDPDASPPVPGGGIIEDSYSTRLQLATFEGGITGPADHPCLLDQPHRPDPIPFLYFTNGRITVPQPGPCDDVGDLNLNGLAYELADAVLYANYFIHGPSVFVINVAAQSAASDVNGDGVPLTVADLTYLIRLTQGFQQLPPPCGNAPPDTNPGWATLSTTAMGSVTQISMESSRSVGAILLNIAYTAADIANVETMGPATTMDLMWRAESDLLKILIWDYVDGDSIPGGSGQVVRIQTTGGGSMTLVDAQTSTYGGALMQTAILQPVTQSALEVNANVPNPFNATTRIRFHLSSTSDYSLTIYNIVGQMVRTYDGQAEAGTVTVTWDGRDHRNSQVASGVYFYVVEAGGFTATKRMLLLK